MNSLRRDVSHWSLILASALALLLGAACVPSLIATPTDTPPPTATPPPATEVETAQVVPSDVPVAAPAAGAMPTALPEAIIAEADAEELLLINLYQRVNPAVVNIDVSVDHLDDGLLDFGSGSGFVIDTDGHIVTNNHVISGADDMRVTFSDGTVLEAEIVGIDPYADLAVLRVDPAAVTLVPAELGDSDSLLVGQRVVAIGNPFGLTGSMTVGIISAVGRRLDTGASSTGGSFSNPLIIQTDAAINPGNSGGPLLDSHGRVIGINTAIRSATGVNTGIGFAVPVNTIKRIVPQLVEDGTVDYPYLGITSNPEVTLGDLAVEYDLPVTEGVLVSGIVSGTAADEAGLQGGTETGVVVFRGMGVALDGDIITAIDDFPVRTFDELIGYLVTNTDVGQVVNLTVIRADEVITVPVTLGSRPVPDSN